MERLQLLSTSSTPAVVFEPETGTLHVSGRSLPENSHDFFQPILNWVDTYVGNPNIQTKLKFELEYFNTSSTAYFLKLIKKFEALQSTGKNVEIEWIYETHDDDMREAGEDFKLLVKIPIQLKEKSV